MVRGFREMTLRALVALLSSGPQASARQVEENRGDLSRLGEREQGTTKASSSALRLRDPPAKLYTPSFYAHRVKYLQPKGSHGRISGRAGT